MADLRLKSIEIRNWMTVKTAQVDFPESGLVLVIGSNLASDGKLQSVGAGKSALGEALSRALLGVKGRFSHLGYFLSDDADNSGMLVRVNGELLDKSLTVDMGFKCQELNCDGESLRFRYGEQDPVQMAYVDQTRERLQKTLQVTPELANWTAFIDGDRLKFNKLSQEDSVNLLMTALAQPPWTEYQEAALKKVQSANKHVAVSTSSLNKAKENKEVCAEELEDAKAEYEEEKKEYDKQVAEVREKIEKLQQTLSGERGAITAAKARMKEIKVRLKQIEDEKAATIQRLEIEYGELKDKLALIDVDWQAASEQKTVADTRCTEAEDALEKLAKVPKVCPTCKKPWDAAVGAEEMAKAEAEVKRLLDIFDQKDRHFSKLNADRKAMVKRTYEIESARKAPGSTEEVEDLGDEYEKQENLVERLTAMAEQRQVQLAKLQTSGVDATKLNNKKAVIDERKRALQVSSDAVEKAAADLVSDEEVLKIVQYWHKAFGPTGIPNMILSDAIPIMNQVAQRISYMMTGGTIQINYSTTRELARGDTKAQLVTRVTNKIGSRRVEGSSKGEGGLTNLVIAENLNEVGQVSNRIGFRWYDEVTSGQDAVVRRSIFSYLKEVAHRLGILIFVVDHHPEASSYADYVLMAEKSLEYGTRYYWS